MRRAAVAATTAALAMASGALADSVFQVDIDALTAQASGAFSETFTGDLHVFNTAADPDTNGNASILDVLIDGNAQGTGGASIGAFSFDMNVSFVGGMITGGTMVLSVDQSGSENTYTAAIASSTNASILDIGGIFLVGGLTLDGLFSDGAGTFLGVDITPWGLIQPVPGSFAQIAYQPDAEFKDMDTDVDVFIAVPLPTGAGMAGLGLLAIGARRRRV